MKLKKEDPVKIIFSSDKDGLKYNSRIMHIHGEYLQISSPTYLGEPVKVEQGMEIEVLFASGRDVFSFPSAILSIAPDSSWVNIDISKASAVQKLQRRSYVRVDTPEIPVKCVIFQTYADFNNFINAQDMAQLKKHVRMGTITNISGGGLSIRTDFPVKEDTLMRIEFMLPVFDLHITHLLVEVVGGRTLSENGYDIFAEYKVIDEGIREKIIQYAYRRQFQIRKKKQ